jgi:dihydrofolate reductase
MRKVIAGTNMTLDGICDHTAIIPDEELHEHYTDLLRSADTLVYGRITYQLMEDAWPAIVKNPTGIADMDDFAVAIDNIPKVVFSRTLKKLNWDTAKLAPGSIQEEFSALKQQAGGDILVGSPSLIIETLNLGLVDEFQITVHPVIAGKGMDLFKNIHERIELKLLRTKIFAGSGAITLYYEPIRP